MRSFATVLAASVFASLAIVYADAQADALTAAERRWVDAAWPVVVQARQRGLPVDVVVQPQPAEGLAPMALAFVGGRCKLVFSMRDNAAVDAQQARIASGLGADDATLAVALELMAAHELFGHCSRHVAGQWERMPEGYDEATPAALDPALRDDYLAMRATRREEGFADLAALAWVRAERPGDHERLRAWLVRERSDGTVDGSHHDTRAWLVDRDAGRGDVTAAWRDVLLQEARAGR